jgi:hypothetical protein
MEGLEGLMVGFLEIFGTQGSASVHRQSLVAGLV